MQIYKYSFVGQPLILRPIFSIVSKEMDAWFRNIVIENKASRANLMDPPDDFLQLLLNISSKLNASDTEVTGHAVTLFLEGYETSSVVLSFALYELARNPAIQQRVHDEIVDILTRHEQRWTFDALQDLKYLEQVLQGDLYI